jgi:tetratricopeptide (TPR) repeat protein
MVREPERWLPLLVLAVGALVYLPSLRGDWVWDDVYQFRDNPAITHPWVLVTHDVWSPTGQANPENVPIYRPLAMVSHVPGQILWRGPLVERLVNLALHLGVALGVALLAGALGLGRRAAWFAAACLAWHPAASEGVAWISSRGDLMGAGLVLGGVIAFARGRDLLAGALFALAPFCKETFVLAPLSLAIWMGGLRRLSLPALALSLAGVAAYFALRIGLGIPLPSGAAAGSASQVLAAVGAVAVRAAELLAIPTAPDALPAFRGQLAAGAAALALALPAFAFLPGRPWLAALLAPLPLLAPCAPAALANGLVSDRYFYVAMVGLGVAAAFAYAALETRVRVAPALFALPLVLTPFTALRARDWVDNGHLFAAALARNPDSAEAQFQVAFDLHTVHGDCRGAIPLYERAMEQSPRAGNNLQACLLALGRAAQAAELGPRLAARDPANPTPALNTARAHAVLGQPAEAERWAREAVRRRPDRGASYVLLGNVLGLEGRHAEALAAFERALQLAPGDPAAQHGVAVAQRQLLAAGGDAP